MTIKEIKEKGVATVNGLVAVVDKGKKSNEHPSGAWTHQVVLADDTGKLLATLPTGRAYNPVCRGRKIKIISGVLDNADGKAYGALELMVESWEYVDQVTADEYYADKDAEWLDKMNLQVRGKIKCLYIARLLERMDAPTAFRAIKMALTAAKSPDMKELIDETIKG